MRILLIGPYGSIQREPAIARGFRECGALVSECSYGSLLFSKNPLYRLQFRFGRGPVYNRLTSIVISSIRSFNPDVVLFRRPLEFSELMIREIRRETSAIFASFNNDDPFSSKYSDIRWEGLRKAIPEFDIHFAFRAANISQFEAAGAKHVALWEPFYSPWIHRPLVGRSNLNVAEFKLLFAMHAEKDERRDVLLELVKRGVRVDIHSWNWGNVFGKAEAEMLGVKPPIWGDDYVHAINGASAALCLFSKQNNDELTSRVFEIPACKGLLLSRRTDRLMQLFKDGDEAFFFSSVDELLNVVERLSNDTDLVTETKKRGHNRLLKSRHSIVDRCADAITEFERLM